MKKDLVLEHIVEMIHDLKVGHIVTDFALCGTFHNAYSARTCNRCSGCPIQEGFLHKHYTHARNPVREDNICTLIVPVLTLAQMYDHLGTSLSETTTVDEDSMAAYSMHHYYRHTMYPLIEALPEDDPMFTKEVIT